MFNQMDWLARIKIATRLKEAEHDHLVWLARDDARARRVTMPKWTDHPHLRVIHHIAPREAAILHLPRRRHAA